jgi:predicted nucleic-acid-binding Zn-ribbon protein
MEGLFMKRSGKCPKCGYNKIASEERVFLSEWLKKDLKVQLYYCESCGYIEQYFIGKEMHIL